MSTARFTPPLADAVDIPVAPPWHTLESRGTRWAKRAAAFALAGAFFLPLTSCQGKDLAPADWMTPESWTDATLVFLAFFWPLLYEGTTIVAAQLASAFGHPWGRLALVGASVLALASMAFPAVMWDGHLRHGIFVAVSALLGYTAPLVVLWRRRRRWQPPA
jgi:hypothetical protein